MIAGIITQRQKKEDFHSKEMSKEIELGWSLILPENCHKHIPGLILNPMGLATHIGITSTGEFLPQNRVMHDLSFPAFL